MPLTRSIVSFLQDFNILKFFSADLRCVTGGLHQAQISLLCVSRQNVEPPILPNIFLPTLTLQGDASKHAAKDSGSVNGSHSVLLGPRNNLAVIRGLDGKMKKVCVSAVHDFSEPVS